ncbi:MAG TPA: A/G-specific adenine glycosylase [Gemmatimonadales bacterium]|nr:A/G-specific adenine glycosylase [Gemmatimonadales bacterium]
MRRFRTRLLSWFRRHGRDLPWRRTRDPYRVLVSEFMLQQTQVSRVTEYYPRFLERFDSIEALARARGSAVREAWAGLGYYARARNLHALARQVSAIGGQVPEDPAELVKLPGVGRYTAGAVACFAYEKPVAAVDTNVARVVRRVFYGDGGREPTDGSRRRATRPASSVPHHGDIWDIAQLLVPRTGKSAWAFNQAVMELGATVCVARKPKCGQCPVVRDCKTGKG